MKDLTLGLVQAELLWEDVRGNLDHLDELLDLLPEDIDLVVLPETFSTGFTMHAREFAEEEGGPAGEWMLRTARERDIHLMGSLIFKEKGRIHNRLFHISPAGIEGHYDKRHLFRMGREDEHFIPGNSRVVFQVGEFRTFAQVCYDLLFPVFARNRNDYDAIVYVANWPAPRHMVWETLLRARAIENQAWVLGVSRSGRDGEGVDHLGGSCVVDPRGRVLEQLGPEESMLIRSIGIKEVRELREKFPVWRDADKFHMEL